MPLLRRLAVLAALMAALLEAAAAQTARVTFILVNDIYLMGDQAQPDGQRRGGFARLAAVVKAERARAQAAGAHVVFAHAGDTLSPSLMSGLDRGAHIITLTNMIAPDIFVPGNHEFDFGPDVFMQRMAEATFPLFGANLRGADGKPLANLRDRAILTFDGVRIGLTGSTYDDTPRVSSSGDLRFQPTVATTREQADRLRQEGADFVVAVVHADRRQDDALFASRAADLILTGHDHDLFVNYDGRNAMVESSYDALYVTAIDVTISVKEQDGRRVASWWPQFRVIDTATVTADTEVAAVVASFEAELSREMDVPLATTAIELDSRNATVRTGEAAIGNLIADAMRASAKADVAITNGGGIRAGRVYAAGSRISRRDVLAELPFGNRVVTLSITGAALKRAIENGLSQLPDAAGRFPQVSGMAVEAALSRPPGNRVTAITVGGAPLDDDAVYTVATNDFLARGGDGYSMFADAARQLNDSDAPLLANEVMVHMRRLGIIKAGIEGRILLR
ncbi:MAG: bifunctional metallophosphatase/5'-nucleotidase [Hyphomicrobiales bacterium]|nr:bifunctional metallophosphatase/5'-nucleotidase [Hyphomicrobiales bacterium]